MNYSQALQYIHSLERFGIQPGLGRVRLLCEALGNPQDKLEYIHIAGTNGKGSTATMLSEICIAAGKKTGLYISPYVVDFRERIQINGKMIPHRDFAALIERIAACRIPELTEFEAVTAAALIYFDEQHCDWVVLETGLGGRLDATNVIQNPAVTVITPISLDHSEILGSTIDKIAAEKCGIIKPNGMTICANPQPEDAMTVIRQSAAKRNNRLILPNPEAVSRKQFSLSGITFTYKGLDVSLPLCGQHQLSNALTAIETALALSMDARAITAGLKQVCLPARVEVLRTSPPLILDGAHNPEKTAALINTVSPFLTQKAIFVFGTLADKDYRSELDLIAPVCRELITVTPPGDRALPAGTLAGFARAAGLSARSTRSTAKALALAFELAENKAPVIIFGSLYLAAAVRPKLCQIIQ